MIGLIGKVSMNGGTNSGQVIRTTVLYKALLDHYGNDRVYLANIRAYKRAIFSNSLSLIKCIIMCDKIILMVHDNGRKFFFPVMSILKKLFHKRIYHNVIGGNFFEFLQECKQDLLKRVMPFYAHQENPPNT